MAKLFKHLRVHQIFGANTSVGKTVLTTALARTSALSRHVFYLKPVSTGPDHDSDDSHVWLYTRRSSVSTACLWRFQDPVSPHLAARIARDQDGSKNIPSDSEFVNSIAAFIDRCASGSSSDAHLYIESAGGVHSPTPSSTSQVDAYRPLLLPTILIGSSQLGGISATISAYESLLIRGYTIDCILLFGDTRYGNAEYLKDYFARHSSGIYVQSFQDPPQRLPNPEDDFLSMEKYYASITTSEEMTAVIRRLDSRHTERIGELDSMPRRTLDTIWWPFVQHGLVQREEDVTVIDSAHSDFFSVYRSQPNKDKTSLLQPHFDGSASWWTQTLGHAESSLTLAAARAAGRYGHVMFPQAIHLPALRLAERLIRHGPGKGWASRVFFSDNGSTGMEVALKMALRAFCRRDGKSITIAEKKRLGVLGLKGSYHGDTIGAMDACEGGVFTCEWHNAKGYWLDSPTVSIREGNVVLELPTVMMSRDLPPVNDIMSLSAMYDIPQRLDTPLAAFYRSYVTRTLADLRDRADVPPLAALVLEPLVMGSGGMIFVDPLFQRVMIDTVRGPRDASSQWAGLPVIFDEVFVGFHRIGTESTISILGATPDISVNAKMLTGGLVPLAVTLASDSIFQAFWSQNKADAFLHGHSYTAHAVGCEVANETLRLMENYARNGQWNEAKGRWAASKLGGTKQDIWSLWDPHFVAIVSCEKVVAEVMALGTVLSIKIKDHQAGYSSMSAQTLLHSLKTCADDAESASGPFKIHFRTLGNVAYFMTSLNTTSVTIRAVEDRIGTTLRAVSHG